MDGTSQVLHVSWFWLLQNPSLDSFQSPFQQDSGGWSLVICSQSKTWLASFLKRTSALETCKGCICDVGSVCRRWHFWSSPRTGDRMVTRLINSKDEEHLTLTPEATLTEHYLPLLHYRTTALYMATDACFDVLMSSSLTLAEQHY